MTKTEKLTDLVEQASSKNPLMAAGIIKQAAGLSADILSEHERRLETAAGAVGQLAGSVNELARSAKESGAVVDKLAGKLSTLIEVVELQNTLRRALVGRVEQLTQVVAELAARNGMAAHFAESTAPGVIVEGEYTHG